MFTGTLIVPLGPMATGMGTVVAVAAQLAFFKDRRDRPEPVRRRFPGCARFPARRSRSVDLSHGSVAAEGRLQSTTRSGYTPPHVYLICTSKGNFEPFQRLYGFSVFSNLLKRQGRVRVQIPPARPK
jgi:hypothetical protein